MFASSLESFIRKINDHKRKRREDLRGISCLRGSPEEETSELRSDEAVKEGANGGAVLKEVHWMRGQNIQIIINKVTRDAESGEREMKNTSPEKNDLLRIAARTVRIARIR